MSKTTTKKPAAPARKPAKKTAPPIIVGGDTGMLFPAETTAALIDALPVSRLKELLRERGLPIPKDKAVMVARLITWAVRQGGTFVLSFH